MLAAHLAGLLQTLAQLCPRAMQSLERLRLHNESISPSELANIGEAPKLRVGRPLDDRE